MDHNGAHWILGSAREMDFIVAYVRQFFRPVYPLPGGHPWSSLTQYPPLPLCTVYWKAKMTDQMFWIFIGSLYLFDLPEITP